jgi:hypothetical protein
MSAALIKLASGLYQPLVGWGYALPITTRSSRIIRLVELRSIVKITSRFGPNQRAGEGDDNQNFDQNQHQTGNVSGYCGKPSSSLTQFIFSVTQMCSVGAKAWRSSKTASAIPAVLAFVRRANSRVPHFLQNTRSIASDEG